MTNKPTTIWGYGEDNLANVRSTCLYVATKLGDFLEDIVIVGGLVPSLLVDRGEVLWGMESHAGTLDIDIGLALAILDEERYRSLGERLQEAGFAPDTNENGNPTHQRWRSTFGQSVAIDFLIPPTGEGDIPGRLKHILPNLAAFVIPGLHVAFCDRQKVTLQGHTPSGEEAEREVWSVHGPEGSGF